MARAVNIGRSIGAGGKLAGKCVVEFIRLKNSSKAAVRAFELSLIEEGVPPETARELAGMYPKVEDLRGFVKSGK